MRHVPLVAVVVLGASTLALAAQQPPAVPPAAPGPVLSAQRLDDRIIVRVDDRTFTCYRFGAGQKYPYFYPVNGPLSGVSVTTESSLPWPHHRSLFFGSDKVNGGNYWQEGNEEGQIVSRGPTVVVSGPDRVEITDECEWRKPGTAPILIDKREIRIEAPSPQLRTLRFRVTLVPQTEVRIEKTNHSLFAARVAPELSAQAGGVLLNAAGALGEKGTYGASVPLVRRLGDALRPARGDRHLRQPEEPLVPVEVVHPRLRLLLPHALQLARRRGAAPRQGRDARARVHGRRPRRRRGGGGDRGALRDLGRGASPADRRLPAVAVAGLGAPRWNSLGVP